MYTNRWLLANGILMTQKWSHTRLWCWSWKSDCTIQSHTMIWIHDRKGRYTRNQRHDFAKFTQFRLIPQSWLDPFTHIDLCGNIKWLSNSSYQQLWLNMRYTFLPHQMTENFIVVPETSYMYDPCVRCDLSNNPLKHFTECTLIRRFGDPELAGWEQEYKYEDKVDGLVTVMNKTNGTDIHHVKCHIILFSCFCCSW